jgi:serine protease
MHISEPNDQNTLSPKFEGFFLQMVMPGLEGRVSEIVTQTLGTDWEVKPIGDNFTEFEVTQREDALSVKGAWDKSYHLLGQSGVVDAQPLFAVPFRGETNQQEADIDAESSDVDWSLKQIRVFETWSRFFPDPNQLPGNGITIGHPDTGYTEHPEIISNLLVTEAYDFLKNDSDAKDELETPPTELINNPGHGTSTASVAISPRGGQANYPSGKAITGVAPGAKLVPIRVSFSVVLLSVLNLATAIEYAADRGIHILSISLGTGFFNQRLRSAIIYAQKRGVIIVAASGTTIPYVVWPAAYEEVIAVTGSNIRREIWKGSSRGKQVDVTAPGQSIWFAKTQKQGDKITYDVLQGNGTSFSAPIVAGVAALWLSYHGRDQLIARYGAEKIPFIFNQILRDSCEKFPTWKPNKFGAGIVNTEKVLAAPLPDNINASLMAPAFALQQFSSIDSGRFDSFTHLFDSQIPDNRDNTIETGLAQLLQIPESELPNRLKEVGQELAFCFATNPQLYNQFAVSLTNPPNQLLPDQSNNLQLAREILLNQDVSEVLKGKLGVGSRE